MPEEVDYAALLGEYVEGDASDDNVTRAATAAEELVTRRIDLFGIAGVPVPDSIKTEAILAVGSDLYYRRTARNGIVGLSDLGTEPMRISKNPLAAAEGILAPYLILTGL